MSKSEQVPTAAGAAQVQPDREAADELLKRRNFLIGAGLGGVAAAAAAVGGAAVEQAGKAEPAAEAQVESKGYRATEHVRRYYGTTRI